MCVCYMCVCAALHIFMRSCNFMKIHVVFACLCACLFHVCLCCITYIRAHFSLYRVAKTHRMAYLYRSFSAKEPYN